MGDGSELKFAHNYVYHFYPQTMDRLQSPRSILCAQGTKADREKMRRDKLNEQFQELGNTIGMMQFAVLSIKIG